VGGSSHHSPDPEHSQPIPTIHIAVVEEVVSVNVVPSAGPTM
jgi:hypothetical protein